MLYYKDEQWLESKDFPFYCAPYTFFEGDEIPLHYHHFVEMVYVSEGNCLHFYKGEHYRIKQGDIFIIQPGVPHAYIADTGHAVVYNILFQPLILESELNALSKVHSFIDFFYIEPFFRKYSDFQTHLSLGPQEQLEVMMHLHKLEQEFSSKSMGYTINIKSRMLELFVTLSRFYSTRSKQQWAPILDESKLFEEIADFIKLHFAQSLSLEQVSARCGMSVSSFSAKFKSYFHKTFVEYRNGVRIGIAKDLLISTDEKISTIAGTVGFDDLSFFNRMFRRETGLSPKQYRTKYKEEFNSLYK